MDSMVFMWEPVLYVVQWASRR